MQISICYSEFTDGRRNYSLHLTNHAVMKNVNVRFPTLIEGRRLSVPSLRLALNTVRGKIRVPLLLASTADKSHVHRPCRAQAQMKRPNAGGAGLRMSLAVHGQETSRCWLHPARHAQAVKAQASRLPHSTKELAHIFILSHVPFSCCEMFLEHCFGHSGIRDVVG